MRPTAYIMGLTALSIPLLIAPQASARTSSQSTAHCTALASRQHLTGRQRTRFIASCKKGPLAPARPTGPTGSSQEAQAITKPSGVDRTTRAKQCTAESNRKGLAGKDQKAFQLSCLATAGPVTEGETGTHSPQPAHSINGIGVNNNRPNAAPATSAPAHDAPPAVRPHP